MNRTGYISWVVLVGVLGCTRPAKIEAQSPARGRDAAALENGWYFDYAEAKVQAQKTGKPMMVVFRCVP